MGGVPAMVCPVCKADDGSPLVVSKSRRHPVASCGQDAVAAGVTVRDYGTHDHAHASASGLRRCGNGWTCPHCARAAQAADAEELHNANLGFRNNGDKRQVYMVTLTIPHSQRDRLKPLREAVTVAYRKTHTGEPEMRRRAKWAVVSSVRRLEVTRGPNGWHPHVHAMLFCDRTLAKAELQALGDWYHDHWGAKIEAAGYQHPSRACVVVTVADREGRYLAKMGLLELAGDTNKQARCAQCGKHVYSRWEDGKRACVECGHEVNRTPWQILADWHSYHEPRDRELWRTYAREIWGARRLTYSRWKGGVDVRELYPTDAEGNLARKALERLKRRAAKAKREGKPAPAVPEHKDRELMGHEPLAVPRHAWRKMPHADRLALIELYEVGDRNGIDALLVKAGGGLPAPPATFNRCDPDPNAPVWTWEERQELRSAGVRTHKRS